MKKTLAKRIIFRRIIAVCIALVLSTGFAGWSGHETLVIEEHELPVALADGNFDREDSSYDIGGEGEYKDTERKRSINILEIVGDYRMAMIGFLIDGCEPIGSGDMDAIVNTYPGKAVPQYQVYFKGCNEFNVNNRGDVSIYELAMNTGDQHAMYYYPKTMNGYYEYVGENKGSYALDEIKSQEMVGQKVYVKDVVMVSKYADNKKKHKTSYNYVWVEDGSLKDFGSETIEHKTEVAKAGNETKNGDKIYVYNHYKNKYVNNELFLCLMSNMVDGLDHSKGAYDGGRGWSTGGMYSDPNSINPNSNYDKIQEWRKKNTVTVVTKEPSKVTCADVDNADLIFVINGESDGSYKKVFGINCYATGDFTNKKNTFSTSNDISVPVLKRIFKHIVVDEDAAIAYSHMNCTGTWNLDTNIKKLGFMLSYVKSDKKYSEGDNGVGTGRDFFRNLFENYGQNAADVNNSIDRFNNDTQKTTDFIKIDDNGNLCINGTPNSTWGAADYEFQNNWLFNDYLKNRYGSNGDLTYKIDGGDISDKSKYRNQMIFKESWNMFMSSGGAKDLFSIMSHVNPANHTVQGDKETKKAYFLSMNIFNGDSVTPERKEVEGDKYKNKTLYINKYEIEKMASTYKLPIKIRMVTSHPIVSIIVKKKNGTPIYTYSKSGGVLKGGGKLGDLDVTDDTEYDANGKPPHINEKDYDKYSLSAEIGLEKSYFSSGANNTFIIEAVIEPAAGESRTVDDKITIVTRDFFGLN